VFGVVIAFGVQVINVRDEGGLARKHVRIRAPFLVPGPLRDRHRRIVRDAFVHQTKYIVSTDACVVGNDACATHGHQIIGLRKLRKPTAHGDAFIRIEL
jgi:hypothetical protein